MNRREALLLRAFAVWTVYVWGTRIWNVVRDAEHDLSFKVVHATLALVSIAFAVVAWRVVGTVRARERMES